MIFVYKTKEIILINAAEDKIQTLIQFLIGLINIPDNFPRMYQYMW